MYERNAADLVDASSRDSRSAIAGSLGVARTHDDHRAARHQSAVEDRERPAGKRDAIDDLPAGRGFLELAVVAGRATATRVMAASPLKFLIPRRRGTVSWVYSCTLGGGLVAGDVIDMDVRLGPNVTCVMSTQSSTKVYKSPAGLPCRQKLRASVADHGTLILIPDPVACFAGARYEQDHQIHLDSSSALVVVDWLTSGRLARGERWALTRYQSRLDISMGSDLLLADRLLLDPADGQLESPYRLGRFNCLAIVAVVGRRFQQDRERLLAQYAAKPIARNSSIIEVASPIRHGIILRVLGEQPQHVVHWVRQTLSFLEGHLGDAPWARKW